MTLERRYLDLLAMWNNAVLHDTVGVVCLLASL